MPEKSTIHRSFSLFSTHRPLSFSGWPCAAARAARLERHLFNEQGLQDRRGFPFWK